MAVFRILNTTRWIDVLARPNRNWTVLSPHPILVGASDWIDMITSTGVGESGAKKAAPPEKPAAKKRGRDPEDRVVDLANSKAKREKMLDKHRDSFSCQRCAIVPAKSKRRFFLGVGIARHFFLGNSNITRFRGSSAAVTVQSE